MSKVTEKTETAVMAETPEVAPVQQKEPKIYIGPTIPGVARNNQVFEGGVLPKALTEKKETIPAIGALIIPVSKLGTADQQLRIENSTLNVLYKKTLDAIQKGE